MALDSKHGLHSSLIVECVEMLSNVYGVFEVVAEQLVCGIISLGEIVFQYSLAYPQGVYGSGGTLETVHDGRGIFAVEIVCARYLKCFPA